MTETPQQSHPVRVSRRVSDLGLAGAGALVGLAVGSAVGIPWELGEPPADDDVVEPRGNGVLLPGEWGVDVHLAILVSEVVAEVDVSTEPGRHLLAQRILTWYDSEPAHVPLSIQRVCEVARNPGALGEQWRSRLAGAGCGAQVMVNAATAMETAAEVIALTTPPRLRHHDSSTLAMMVPVALAGVEDRDRRHRGATAVSTLVTADPVVTACHQFYAHLVARALTGSGDYRDREGDTWFDPTTVAHAFDDTVTDRVGDGGDEWVTHALSALLPDSTGTSTGLGFARTRTGGGAGLDPLSALARIFRAIDAATALTPGAQGAARTVAGSPVRRVIDAAVRGGGDTDTVACLAGALAGAACGLAHIPDDWARRTWGWPGMRVDGMRDLGVACVYRGLDATGAITASPADRSDQ